MWIKTIDGRLINTNNLLGLNTVPSSFVESINNYSSEIKKPFVVIADVSPKTNTSVLEIFFGTKVECIWMIEQIFKSFSDQWVVFEVEKEFNLYKEGIKNEEKTSESSL